MRALLKNFAPTWQLAEVARRMGFTDAFPCRAAAEIFAGHTGLSAFENEGARAFDIGAYAGTEPEEYASAWAASFLGLSANIASEPWI